MKHDIPTVMPIASGPELLKHRRKPVTLKLYGFNEGRSLLRSTDSYWVYTDREVPQHMAVPISRFIGRIKEYRPELITMEKSITSGIGDPEIIVSFRKK
jgi:hypothetical protein